MAEARNGWTAGRLAGRALAYALFAGGVAYLSASPVYEHLPPGQALVRLSISHPGQLIGECRRLTATELARLPPNMRQAQVCPRERSPLRVRVELDGAPLYDEVLEPKGLTRDGAASAYKTFPVSAGDHRIRVLLRDTTRIQGFNYERAAEVELRPGQVLTIDFNAARGGVLFL
jgi:hypothetical protein